MLCVHFGVRYLCTIYMYKHLYFSCGNVDIYDNVNIEAGGAGEPDFKLRLGKGEMSQECNLIHRYLSGSIGTC